MAIYKARISTQKGAQGTGEKERKESKNKFTKELLVNTHEGLAHKMSFRKILEQSEESTKFYPVFIYKFASMQSIVYLDNFQFKTMRMTTTKKLSDSFFTCDY